MPLRHCCGGNADTQQTKRDGNTRVEKRVTMRQHVDIEDVQGDRGETGLKYDFPRLEPVEALPAVEHHLQCTDADGERQESEPVEFVGRITLGFWKKQDDAEQRNKTERRIGSPAVSRAVGILKAKVRRAHGSLGRAGEAAWMPGWC